MFKRTILPFLIIISYILFYLYSNKLLPYSLLYLLSIVNYGFIVIIATSFLVIIYRKFDNRFIFAIFLTSLLFVPIFDIAYIYYKLLACVVGAVISYLLYKTKKKYY